MDAGELFKAGRLAEAIAHQLQEVKTHPADPARRVFLFELLCFEGDLDRARRQADAIRFDQVELEAAISAYRLLIDAERERRRVFEEGADPRFFGAVPEHARLRIEAAGQLRQGHAAECRATLERAAEASPPVRGVLDGRTFQSLTDCDDLFGPILEVMLRDEYYWVPLEQVRSLTMGPPKYPRDLIWAPAELELAASSGAVFLPVLYPGSHRHPDEPVKLGRMTDWKHSEDQLVIGVGAHLYLVDDEEVGLLEWRDLTIEADEGAAAEPEPGASAPPESES